MLEELLPLAPIDFIQIQFDCHYGKQFGSKHRLPDLSGWNAEENFAILSLSWHEEGLNLLVLIEGAFDQPDFPDFQRGDSIELFFDTRDVKSSGFNTRFCHHFYFLPLPVEYQGEPIQAGEATHFRTEERHELCDPALLQIKKVKKGRFEIFIPSETLHGYDPSQFNRLGFTYRINRIDGSSQCFSANDRDFAIEQQPALWASLVLKK